MSTPLHLVRDGKKTPIPLEGEGAISTGHFEVEGICVINVTHNQTPDSHYAYVTELGRAAHIGADATLDPGQSVELKYAPGASVEHEAEEL